MKHKFILCYQQALLAYLQRGSRARLQSAHGMGQQALAAGLQTLDIAKLHEHILITVVLPGWRPTRRSSSAWDSVTPLRSKPRGPERRNVRRKRPTVENRSVTRSVRVSTPQQYLCYRGLFGYSREN